MIKFIISITNWIFKEKCTAEDILSALHHYYVFDKTKYIILVCVALQKNLNKAIIVE